MDLGIDGRVALVIGASKGIGRGIAAALAREGARVAMASRSQERIDAAAAEIDGDTTGFEADSLDLERMAALPGEVAERLGPVEILVVNTGGPPLGGALDNPQEEWERAYRELVLSPARGDSGGAALDAGAGLRAGSRMWPRARSASRSRTSRSRTRTGWRPSAF